MILVKIIKDYNDSLLKKRVFKGEILEVANERGTVLISANVGVKIEQETKVIEPNIVNKKNKKKNGV